MALSTYLADRPLDEIAGAFGITASAVVRLVDRLEEGGSPSGGRGRTGAGCSVRLTAKGDRRAKAILARREHELAGVLALLSAAEQRELTRLHEKLLAHLPDGVPGARRVCRYCDVHACGHYDGRCPVTRGIDDARPAEPSRRRPSARATRASARTASSPGPAADLAEGVATGQEVDLRAVGMADHARRLPAVADVLVTARQLYARRPRRRLIGSHGRVAGGTGSHGRAGSARGTRPRRSACRRRP